MPFPSQIGKRIQELPTPCLIIGKKAFQENCNKMLAKAQEMGVLLRAQTKTHKTVEGAILQTGGTKKGLVVSTLAEAEMYADSGFDDILYGYPLSEHHMKRNFALAEKLSDYHVMVNNEESTMCLINHEPPKGKKWSVFLKIDAGYSRAGVPSEDRDQLHKIAKLLMKSCAKIDFQGLYCHCGNSYKGSNSEEIQNARDEAILKLYDLANFLKDHGLEVRCQGFGSTPSCSQPIPLGTDGVTEIHPGNYVFYDLQQHMLGSCNIEDISARVLTRVIGKFPGDRNQMIIDAGFTALSQQGFDQLGSSYAAIKGHPSLKVVHMTQEIGFVGSKDPSLQIDFASFPMGSTLELLQYHSCDTAMRHQVYFVHDEDGIVIEEWMPTRCW